MRLIKLSAYLATCLAIVSGTITVLPSTARASSMDCLEESKGRVVKWNSSWQAPTGDQEIAYEIVSVRIKNVVPDRSVTLELVSEAQAQQKRRTLVVTTEEKARSVCERLMNDLKPLSLPGGFGSRLGEGVDPGEKPFIQYSLQDGWVRANPPKNKKLAICKVQSQEFSCLDEDRERYSSVFPLLEEELRTGVK